MSSSHGSECPSCWGRPGDGDDPDRSILADCVETGRADLRPPSPVWVTRRPLPHAPGHLVPTVDPWRSLVATCWASARPSRSRRRRPSCRGAGPDSAPVGATPTPVPRPTTPVASSDGPRFPGQPPAGHDLLRGVAPPRPLARRSGRQSSAHPRPQPVLLHARPQRDRTAGRAAARTTWRTAGCPTCRSSRTSTWAPSRRGRHDDWLDGHAPPARARCRRRSSSRCTTSPRTTPAPRGCSPSDYVAMQRRAIELAADLAPQVTVVPVLQHWTFDPLRDDIDPDGVDRARRRP